MASVRFVRASALCYRLFDIGEGIDLEQARKLLTAGQRLTLQREGSEYIQLSNPPLTVAIGTRPLVLKAGATSADVSVRVFDHGALSVIVRLPLPSDLTCEQLIPVVDELYDSPAIDALAQDQVRELRATLERSIELPHLWEKYESYTVLSVPALGDGATPQGLLDDPALPRLLLGETKERDLSAAERADVLGHHFRYGEHDLVIIDWNAALVLEPSGSSDLPDLLEIANAHLLELRYYDDVLDRELNRVYDEIGRRKGSSLFRSPWKGLLRELMLTLIELSEFIERAENSLRIVGDVYLARVYEAALTQLRVDRWQGQVTRKQRLLEKTYELLKGEVDTDRALTLEVMVVVLIILELAVAVIGFWPH